MLALYLSIIGQGFKDRYSVFVLECTIDSFDPSFSVSFSPVFFIVFAQVLSAERQASTGPWDSLSWLFMVTMRMLLI